MSTIAVPRPSRHNYSHGNCGFRHATERLGLYTDDSGEHREVVCLAGAGRTRLVIDRSADGLSDARVVAHLAADEPAENAQTVGVMYLAEAQGQSCRPVTVEDFERAFGEGSSSPHAGAAHSLEVDEGIGASTELVDRRGSRYRLDLFESSLSIPELRWCRAAPRQSQPPEAVSVREVIGAIESYEPVRALTLAAVERCARHESVSVAVLRCELDRVSVSPIVLNRGVREAVNRLLAQGEVTSSEIAIRCGRFKRDARGNISGETGWLARRIGERPEGGHAEPRPWIHSDVLALIARDGLAVNPNEVEL